MPVPFCHNFNKTFEFEIKRISARGKTILLAILFGRPLKYGNADNFAFRKNTVVFSVKSENTAKKARKWLPCERASSLSQ